MPVPERPSPFPGRETEAMAFGQASGPPATHSQLRELTELLQAAGHSDFRDARGPMGFTQRQANGKFTRDEADEFIAALQEAAEDTPTPTPDLRRLRRSSRRHHVPGVPKRNWRSSPTSSSPPNSNAATGW
jgi:hypothetical protein